MDNIINLNAEREKRTVFEPYADHKFSLDVFDTSDGSLSCRLHEFSLDDGLSQADRLRAFAKKLEEIAGLLRDDAHVIEPNDDGLVLARVMVWQSSRVTTWASNKVETEEQVEWLRERLDEAKGSVAPLQASP